MNSLRTAAASLVLIALAVGYALSQKAFFTSTTSDYSKQVDQPLVSSLAMLIVVLCLASAVFSMGHDRSGT